MTRRRPLEPRLNRLLVVLGLAVLVGTLSLLGWLRRNATDEMERVIANAAGSFSREPILHGPGGDTLVRFRQVEPLVEQVLRTTYVRRAVMTKMVDGREHPVMPITFWGEHGDRWEEQLTGWRREPLGEAAQPFGYLYLDLNLSAPRTINLAIGAVAISIGLILVALLARLLSQESSLTRTVIELDERRRELIRLERLALGGQLAAGILHDLRKPVLNIRHNLDDIDEALGDFAPAAASLQNLRHQTGLFFQILQESQLERFVQSDRAGEEYVSLGPILDTSLNLVRYERRAVEVIRRDGPGLPPMLAHPYRLVQLFSNLILNAYQAMDGQGRLTIDAEQDGTGWIDVKLSDNGPGIDPERLERIFEPFFTTKPEGEGTGLGLSICRMIAEEMGGTIGAESRAGGPTTFTVRLPVEQTPAPVATAE